MHECLDCFLKSDPNIHGNCPGCGSRAIFELAKGPTDREISDGNIAQLQRMAQAIVPDWEMGDYD